MNGLNGLGNHMKRLEEKAPKQRPLLFFSLDDVSDEVRQAFEAFYEKISGKIDEEHERPYRALSDDELEQLAQWVEKIGLKQ
jgi:hypothetical protein